MFHVETFIFEPKHGTQEVWAILRSAQFVGLLGELFSARVLTQKTSYTRSPIRRRVDTLRLGSRM